MLVRADLHIHSTFSDGKSSPLEIIHVALEKNLDVVSITDHNTFAGNILAQRVAVTYGVLVVPGVEVRTDRGDVLLYCNKKEIDFPRKIDILVEKAHRENCLVVPAHPFDVMRLGIGDLTYEYRDWDAIEVWNASSTKGANYRALEAAKLLNKPGIANSDAHLSKEIGAAHTVIEVSDLTIDNVLESIRKGKVKPFFGEISLRTRFNRLLWSVERSMRDLLK